MSRFFTCLFMILSLLLPFFSLEGRIYFLHMPKTGGTTLRLLLELQVAADEIYPYRNCQGPLAPVKEHLVSGHLPYSCCKKMDPDFDDAFKITVLRDPVERYLSFLRAKKKAETTLPTLESVLKFRHTSKYADGLMANAMCRYLASDPDLQGKELLESAKRNLDTFDCVVFFDEFSQGIIDLFERLDVDFDANDVPKINTTQPEPVSKNLLKQVQRLNQLDTKLYAYAKTHFKNKDSKHTLRTTSFEGILKKADTVDYTFDLPLNGSGWTYRDTYSDTTIDHPIYRWVMDRPANIYFPLEENNDYSFSFYAWPLSEEAIPRVKVNGNEIDLVHITSSDRFSLYQGIIPKEWLQDPLTQISFYADKTFEFRDFYPSRFNRNHPPLSFAVNRIQIFPITRL